MKHAHAAAAALTLALTSCATTAGTPTTAPVAATTAATTCTPADPAQIDAIMQGINTDGITLENAHAATNTADTTWLAAQLAGPGVDGTDVLYLTGNGSPSWGPIGAANNISAEFFDWPANAQANDAAEAAQECARG